MEKKCNSRREFLKRTAQFIPIAGFVAVGASSLLTSCEKESLYNKFEVNWDKCTGCEKCLDVCFYDAIKVEDRTFSEDDIRYLAQINQDKCVKCNKCFERCPEKSIARS